MQNKMFFLFFIYLVYFGISIKVSAESRFNALTIQSDNKLVAGGLDNRKGPSHFLVVRYNQNGSRDNSFGTRGFVITEIGTTSGINSTLLQPSDDKIVAAGSFLSFTTAATESVLVRYNTTGPVDPAFGNNGIVITPFGDAVTINDITIQPDNRIVVVGTTVSSGDILIFLARFNTNGTLDTNFGTDGIVTTQVGTRATGHAVIIQPSDDFIVVAATVDEDSFAALRYNTSGTLDTNFGTNGIVRTTLANPTEVSSMDIQTDEKIVVAGSSEDQITVIRYNTDGTPDTTFGSSGIVQTQIGSSAIALAVKIQTDQKIVIAGSAIDKSIAIRYNLTGPIDISFGDDGIAFLELDPSRSVSLDIQTGGEIVSAGSFRTRGIISQLQSDGSEDFEFDNNSFVLFPREKPIDRPNRNNYLFSYTGTVAQTTTTTLTNITFDVNGPNQGWVHGEGLAPFTCKRSGTYLITFTGTYVESGALAANNVTVQALLNGIEIPGSHINTVVGANGNLITRSFIVDLNKEDVIRFRHRRTGASGTVSLQGTGDGDLPIGGSVTINRLV